MKGISDLPTPEEDKEASRHAAVADAKRLLRLSRTGALATLDADSGAPLTTLVGVASDICGSPLFLMSSLARHSKNIERDPRVSLLLTSTPDRGDPLNHPRLSLGGAIERNDAPNARRRYIQRNPKAKLYASFADFALYRLRIENVHFNGGFGRADLLKPQDILASRAAADEFAGEEARILEELKALDPGALRRWPARRDPAVRRSSLSESTPRASTSPRARRAIASSSVARRSTAAPGGKP